MSDYISISLLDMICQKGEGYVKNIISSFSCPQNKDVEDFLHSKAIEFSRQGISKTHLVFTKKDDKPVLVGYYCLASKVIIVEKAALSRTLQKKINKFTIYDSYSKNYVTSASLIGQLGKNYTDKNNELITGDFLLELAVKKISAIQDEIGGRLTYLECEDNDKLINFYKKNGFVVFGKRELEKDETDSFRGKYLMQMLRYI